MSENFIKYGFDANSKDGDKTNNCFVYSKDNPDLERIHVLVQALRLVRRQLDKNVLSDKELKDYIDIILKVY